MRVHDRSDLSTCDLFNDALPPSSNIGRDNPFPRRVSTFDSTRSTRRYARVAAAASDEDDTPPFGNINLAPPTPSQRAGRGQNRRSPFGYENLGIRPLGPSTRRANEDAALARLLNRTELRDFDYDADLEDDELYPSHPLWYESDDELDPPDSRRPRRNVGEIGVTYDSRLPHRPEQWMSSRFQRFSPLPYGGRQEHGNNLPTPSRVRPNPEMDFGGLGFEDEEDPLDGRPYRRGAGNGRAGTSRGGPWRRYHG
ncbi:hypothetical protein EJ03DRAFT_352147 [Teratosphaeria nubilosa]|uniref:Uncharacterized protein n=1 Tax=Teratosphaeria nubilosa TaxID=161662 RepID=A0A6G1L754_9PEZI|nr:hypothetical protein EJ03DRAFT_352147 [Teratosphaeria nubilosa]